MVRSGRSTMGRRDGQKTLAEQRTVRKLILGTIPAVAAVLTTPVIAGTSLDSPTADYQLPPPPPSQRFAPPKVSSLSRAPTTTDECPRGTKSNTADLASLRGNPI